MKVLAAQLRDYIAKIKAAKFARDKATLVDELVPALEKAIVRFEQTPAPIIVVLTDTDHAVDRLIAAVGKNKKFHVGEFHISHPSEFAEAVRDLIKLRGGVSEVIVLRS